jgi:hypothetical protein
MPLDDAVTLIIRSYDKYILERKERLGALATPASNLPVSSHSEEFLPAGPRVQYLLNLLADRRFLTIAELTTVTDYLEERKRLLVLSQETSRSTQPLGRGMLFLGVTALNWKIFAECRFSRVVHIGARL